ncbi:alpha/beta-hydrolase [Neoconidiobolus thromboides FSU 785]|nr:alpha/beta-hydrolase [Neoconidiobolus thromboides FSU 785]
MWLKLLLTVFITYISAFNISDPSSFNHKYIQLPSGIYHYVDQGPCEAPLVVLLHGFPESWYTWKYQIDYLVNKLNYRAISLDMAGYGTTVIKNDLEYYTFDRLSNDVIHIVKQLKKDKVVVIGHNWGSKLGWELAYKFPNYVKGFISFSSPYTPNLSTPKTELEKAIINPVYGYQVALNQGNITEFNNNIDKVLKMFWATNKSKLSDKRVQVPLNMSLLEYYDTLNKTDDIYPDEKFMHYLHSQYSIQGFNNSINWYRTSKLNDSNDLKKPNLNILVKSLQILGQNDFLSATADTYIRFIRDITTKYVENGGHWIHFVNSTVVNKYIHNFLYELKY